MMAGSLQNEAPTTINNAENSQRQVLPPFLPLSPLTTIFTRPPYTSCGEYRCSMERNERMSSMSRPVPLKSLPIVPATSPAYQRVPLADSLFLRLPAEIRLQIYALLVLPTHLLATFEDITTGSAQDYFDYDKKELSDMPHTTLCIRTIDPLQYPARYPSTRPHSRVTYSVRGQSMRFRCMNTTYHSINNLKIGSNLGIMRVNKKIHAEVADVLYSNYTFDFDTHVEAIVPFLTDLTPSARSCIKSVRIVKRALAYQKEFDKCEWRGALRALTDSNSGISLRKLELGVVAGRPGENGWDGISTYAARDFELLRTQDEMEWMQCLLGIGGLSELDVRAVVEHCPPANCSSAMANYIRFSASVEDGFKEWLRSQLLPQLAV